MPTPVSTARQCLTEEAARALDDAVAVARRRSHSQTTSLHAVSALLSLPTSTLRDACARARSSAYSPRLQFRALELCVSVSLDRLPSSKAKAVDDEPPVSNSLMAAIKRSQANQRRHPETFHLYQMHQQSHSSQSSLSCVKVELKHFVLSILDDPIVSRVFGDAGFRSSDIKIAILHPPSVSGFVKRFPPLFLCNLPESTINRTGISGINFPFIVDHGEDEFKRIGNVLANKTSKNPLLIGASANTVLSGFTDSLQIGKSNFLPSEIEGLNVVNVSKEIREYVLGNLSEDLMKLKLKEVRENVDSCRNCGSIVNFGDLKVLLDSGLIEFVVSELSTFVEAFGVKLWLIGSVASYDVYMKILLKFPNLEKEWDLHLLPVSSSKLKSSLMGSFVPFGGWKIELENSSSKPDQSRPLCDVCNAKCEEEVSIVLKGGKTVSVADQQATGLSPWLQVPESDSMIEAKDHGGVFDSRVMGLQRKWSDICQRLHHNSSPHLNTSQTRARIPFPPHYPPNPKIGSQDSNQETRCKNLSPPVDFLARTSPSPASITTDLGLGTIYVPPVTGPGPRPSAREASVQKFHGPGSAEIYVPPVPGPRPSAREACVQKLHGPGSAESDIEKDFKQLYTALADKVGHQNDAIRAISETITRVRTGPERRCVFFMFSGSDPVGKKRITTAIAEVVYGSPENMVSIDLNMESQIRQPGSVFSHKNVSFNDPSFRGKTVTEFIAEELTKKPRSVILLEHVDKADFLTRDNLSQAVKTGKLSDSRGRETRITDAIIVFTTDDRKEENEEDLLRYSEERILNAKALQMRISAEKTKPGNSTLLLLPKDSLTKDPEFSRKRKIIETGDFEIMVPKLKKQKSCFDLNLPLEEPEESDNETSSETKDSWLDELLDRVDEKVVFDPFDFDARAETILKQISKCFERSIGRNVVLEIEDEVMVQMLACCWLLGENGGVENWIESVLYRGFMDVKQKQEMDSESMVKLVVVEGVTIEEDDALCVCLPSRIMVN